LLSHSLQAVGVQGVVELHETRLKAMAAQQLLIESIA
jgi:hypothetical protein